MKRPILLIFGPSMILLVLLAAGLGVADTLYLKNGRVVEGIIKAEDEKRIRLDFEYGTIEFSKGEIEQIRRSTPDQSDFIRAKWGQKKTGELSEVADTRPPEVVPRPKGPLRIEHFVVNALLNKSVKARLLVDTGASFIVLSKEVGQKLGVDGLGDNQMVQLQLGDGRRVEAAHVTLKSVRVEEAEASDVAAAVLLDGAESLPAVDGMLGMSFLNRFNFKIDHQKKKLTLEKF